MNIEGVKAVAIKLVSQQKIIRIICIAFLLFTFGNILTNGFVWLDYSYIINNPKAHQINLVDIFYSDGFVGGNYYRPLISLYYACMYVLFAQHAFAYHTVQLLIFLANGYLVYRIFSTFFKKIYSALLGFLFAIHPINQANAAFINNSADTFFMFCGLMALYIYIKDIQYKWIKLVYVLLLMGMFFKETTILFYIAIFSYELVFRKKKLLLFSLYSGITLLSYVVIRFLFGGFAFQAIKLTPIATLPFLERAQSIPLIIDKYLEAFFLLRSIGLAQVWTVDTITWSSFYLPLLIDVSFFSSLFLFGFYLQRKYKKYERLYFYFLFLFCVGLFMHVQIIPLDYTIARRWFYFSEIGLIGMGGICLELLDRHQWKKVVSILLLCGVILVFAKETNKRNTYWKNDLSLFTQARKINNNYIIENQLGVAYLNVGDTENAKHHIKKSIKMFSYDQNLALLGVVYNKRGNTEKAKKYLLEAFHADSYLPYEHTGQIYSEIAKFMLKTKDFKQANIILKEAIKVYPKEDYFWTLDAVNKYAMGNRDAALQSIIKANYLSPNTLNKTLYTRILNNEQFVLNF